MYHKLISVPGVRCEVVSKVNKVIGFDCFLHHLLLQHSYQLCLSSSAIPKRCHNTHNLKIVWDASATQCTNY